MLKACLLPSISRSLSLIRVVYWPFPTLNQIKTDLDICIAWEQLFSLQKSEGPKKLTMFNPLLAGQRMLSTQKLYKVQCFSVCAFMFVCGCAGRCEGRRKTALWSFIVRLSQLGRLIVSFILSKQHNNSSQDRFQKTKKQKKCCITCLCISVIATMANLLHFDTKPYNNSSPPPLRFVAEMSLVFFVSKGGGQLGGTRGWVADWRQAVISLPAWHLPTAANPLLISSRPCAWQQRGFQISFSPRVKNPKPYHFVNGYL